MNFEQAQIMRRLKEGGDCHTFDLSGQDLDFLKSEVKNLLHLGPQLVEFKKADGSIRVMNCTLEADKLPKVELKEGAKPRKESTTSMRVFDLEKNEWRSFTIKNVKRVEFSI